MSWWSVLVLLMSAGSAILNTMIFAHIASLFVSEEKAKIIGFCIILGSSIFIAIQLNDRIASLLGFAVGLAFVWLHLFKREAHG